MHTHDVQVSWSFASDGRSPILSTTLTLTNAAGDNRDGEVTNALGAGYNSELGSPCN